MDADKHRWNLPKQTQFVDWTEQNPRKAGDCWRCCIAAILGLPAEQVPHFLQEELDSRATDDWKDCDQRTQLWLNQRGFVLARISGGYLCFDHAGQDALIPVIKCGPSPRSRKMHQHHAVVYVGNEMVYDPHPSNAGLTAIMEQYLVVPVKPGAESRKQ